MQLEKVSYDFIKASPSAGPPFSTPPPLYVTLFNGSQTSSPLFFQYYTPTYWTQHPWHASDLLPRQ